MDKVYQSRCLHWFTLWEIAASVQRPRTYESIIAHVPSVQGVPESVIFFIALFATNKRHHSLCKGGVNDVALVMP